MAAHCTLYFLALDEATAQLELELVLRLARGEWAFMVSDDAKEGQFIDDVAKDTGLLLQTLPLSVVVWRDGTN